MKLSVVIPAYNAERFIEKSYQNVLAQDLEDFEIIYVDNNSSDETLKEIKKLSELDERVSWYTQSVQGAGPTRNRGLENAKGEYVYFLDVDDEIFPNAVNKLIKVLDDHSEIEVVFGKMKKSSQRIADIDMPTDETGTLRIESKPYWGLKWFSNLKYVVGPPAFLYRRKVLNRVGGYNEKLRIGQDTALDITLGMTSNVAFLDSYIYLYYKHATSTIEQFKEKTIRAKLQWPRFIYDHLPFYLNHPSETQFGKMFLKQLYNILAKQIFFTKGFSVRRKLKSQLLAEIQPIIPPFAIRLYLNFLVLFPFSYVLKFYSYYLVPYIVKK